MIVRHVLQLIAPFSPYTTAAEALACFAADPDLTAAPVVDHNGAPLGIVVRAPLKMKLADKSGYEMFANAPVTQVMDASPLTLDQDVPLAAACEEILNFRPQAFHDGFIITQGGRYVGMGTGLAALDAISQENGAVNERLRLAMRAARVAIWEIDFLRERLIGAEALERIYKRKLTFDDVRRLGPDFVHAEDRDAVRQALMEIAAGSGRGKLRCRIRRPDGGERELSHSVEVFRDDAQQIVRMVLLTADETIAQRVRFEFDGAVDKLDAVLAERREMVDRITAKLALPPVEEHTAEPAVDYGPTYGNVFYNRDRILKMVDEVTLRDQALVAAITAAEGASEAKSRFLASMSHELRTPLNAILGYAEILDEDLSAANMPGPASDAQRIRGAARHLLHLINEILDLSKIEAGRMDVAADTFDAASAVREVIETVRPLADKNANALDIALADDLGHVYTDSFKLNQCLMNLLSNACKFTSAGTIGLTGRRESVRGRDCLVFEVSDSGIGMSDQQMKRLFQPFIQADATTTRNFGGTGLGLAITQRLARLLGGDVTVASELGKGTTFTLYVPARYGAIEAGASGAEQAPVTIDDDENRPLVLVIDDDSVSRDLVRRALARLGFAVAEAASGDEGLRIARARQPVLIILDIQLPDMSGWSVLETLQHDSEFGDAPVMIHSVEDDRARAIAMGACEHVVKPADRELLAAAAVRFARFKGADGARKAPMQNVA
jgi:signal transduction histidine kinase/ActR/RegA family two-component response regulator